MSFGIIPIRGPDEAFSCEPPQPSKVQQAIAMICTQALVLMFRLMSLPVVFWSGNCRQTPLKREVVSVASAWGRSTPAFCFR